MNVELTKDEISLLLDYLSVDICAEKGCLDSEAKSHYPVKPNLQET